MDNQRGLQDLRNQGNEAQFRRIDDNARNLIAMRRQNPEIALGSIEVQLEGRRPGRQEAGALLMAIQNQLVNNGQQYLQEDEIRSFLDEAYRFLNNVIEIIGQRNDELSAMYRGMIRFIHRIIFVFNRLSRLVQIQLLGNFSIGMIFFIQYSIYGFLVCAGYPVVGLAAAYHVFEWVLGWNLFWGTTHAAGYLGQRLYDYLFFRTDTDQNGVAPIDNFGVLRITEIDGQVELFNDNEPEEH